MVLQNFDGWYSFFLFVYIPNVLCAERQGLERMTEPTIIETEMTIGLSETFFQFSIFGWQLGRLAVVKMCEGEPVIFLVGGRSLEKEYSIIYRETYRSLKYLDSENKYNLLNVLWP